MKSVKNKLRKLLEKKIKENLYQAEKKIKSSLDKENQKQLALLSRVKLNLPIEPKEKALARASKLDSINFYLGNLHKNT